MKRSGSLSRYTRLRAQSKKRQRQAPSRAKLVRALLDERPFCEIKWDDRCQFWAVDVDEILGRGVGGDFLDPANCQTTCRHCHHMKHTHPAEAVRRGFTVQRRGA